MVDDHANWYTEDKINPFLNYTKQFLFSSRISFLELDMKMWYDKIAGFISGTILKHGR